MCRSIKVPSKANYHLRCGKGGGNNFYPIHLSILITCMLYNVWIYGEVTC